VKEEADKDIFRSIAYVVEAILIEHNPDEEPCAASPKLASLRFNNNRTREKYIYTSGLGSIMTKPILCRKPSENDHKYIT